MFFSKSLYQIFLKAIGGGGDFQKSSYPISIEIPLKMSGGWGRGKIYSRSYGPLRLVRRSEISSFLLHLYSKNSPKIVFSKYAKSNKDLAQSVRLG